MHHVTTMPDKTTLYVKDWGAGDAVILLSGWPLSADSWDDQALVIAGSEHRLSHTNFMESSSIATELLNKSSVTNSMPFAQNRELHCLKQESTMDLEETGLL